MASAFIHLELAEIPFQDSRPATKVRKKSLDGVSIPWHGGDDFNMKTWTGINVTGQGPGQRQCDVDGNVPEDPERAVHLSTYDHLPFSKRIHGE
jgi:hypothetical protein